jgi:hypothetical protein
MESLTLMETGLFEGKRAQDQIVEVNFSQHISEMRPHKLRYKETDDLAPLGVIKHGWAKHQKMLQKGTLSVPRFSTFRFCATLSNI